jgi:hypothetical protein
MVNFDIRFYASDLRKREKNYMLYGSHTTNDLYQLVKYCKVDIDKPIIGLTLDRGSLSIKPAKMVFMHFTVDKLSEELLDDRREKLIYEVSTNYNNVVTSDLNDNLLKVEVAAEYNYIVNGVYRISDSTFDKLILMKGDIEEALDYGLIVNLIKNGKIERLSYFDVDNYIPNNNKYCIPLHEGSSKLLRYYVEHGCYNYSGSDSINNGGIWLQHGVKNFINNEFDLALLRITRKEYGYTEDRLLLHEIEQQLLIAKQQGLYLFQAETSDEYIVNDVIKNNNIIITNSYILVLKADIVEQNFSTRTIRKIKFKIEDIYADYESKVCIRLKQLKSKGSLDKSLIDRLYKEKALEKPELDTWNDWGDDIHQQTN